MPLFYAQINKKLKIVKLNNYKLRHLALQGAICFVLKKYKTFIVIEILGRGRSAIDFNVAKCIEIEYE